MNLMIFSSAFVIHNQFASADGSDGNVISRPDGVSYDQMKQYGVEHGYIDENNNPLNVPGPKVTKNNIDAKTYKLGFTKTKLGDNNGYIINQFAKTPGSFGTSYNVPTINSDTPYHRFAWGGAYIDGIKGGLNPSGSIGTMAGNNKTTADLIKLDINFKNVVMLDSYFWKLTGLNIGPTTQQKKYQFVNGEVLYHKWLHLDVNKLFSLKKMKNPVKYYQNHKPKNVMDKGYTAEWLNNPKSELKNLNKYYKQSLLKDQRLYSAHNDFDNYTLK